MQSQVFEQLGATRVIEGGQSMNPSAADILEAIDAVPTEDVLVLPNNSNVVLTARAGGGAADKSVRVVPSTLGPGGARGDRRFVPTSAAGRERTRDARRRSRTLATGEITVASRDAVLDGIEIREGAYLGFVEGVAVASDDEPGARSRWQ